MGRISNAEWRHQRLPYLRGLTRLSPLQRLLLELVDLKARTPKQDRELDNLWKAERINDRAEHQRQVAYRIVKDKATEKKRARDRRLIEMGALVEMAELDIDRGVLLGGLLALSHHLKGSDTAEMTARYKLAGDALLKSREQARLDRRQAVAAPSLAE